MSQKEKKAALERIGIDSWARKERSAKTRILDAFCTVTGYTRKYAIKLINKKPVSERILPEGRKSTKKKLSSH